MQTIPKEPKKKRGILSYIGLVILGVFFSPSIAMRQQIKETRRREEEFDKNYEQVGFEKGYIGMRPTSKTIYRKRKTPLQ